MEPTASKEMDRLIALPSDDLFVRGTRPGGGPIGIAAINADLFTDSC